MYTLLIPNVDNHQRGPGGGVRLHVRGGERGRRHGGEHQPHIRGAGAGMLERAYRGRIKEKSAGRRIPPAAKEAFSQPASSFTGLPARKVLMSFIKSGSRLAGQRERARRERSETRVTVQNIAFKMLAILCWQ